MPSSYIGSSNPQLPYAPETAITVETPLLTQSRPLESELMLDEYMDTWLAEQEVARKLANARFAATLAGDAPLLLAGAGAILGAGAAVLSSDITSGKDIGGIEDMQRQTQTVDEFQKEFDSINKIDKTIYTTPKIPIDQLPKITFPKDSAQAISYSLIPGLLYQAGHGKKQKHLFF